MTAPASGDKAAKTRGELLTGPVFPMVVKFGVPTMVSMLTPAIYNLTGAYFVSTLGTTAVAALGIVFSLHMILAAVGIMTGQGCASQTSRLLGAGEYEAAGFIAGTGILLSVLGGVAIGVLGLLFDEPLLRVLGATPTIMPDAVRYAEVLLIGSPVVCASFTFNNLLRSEGLAVVGMRALLAGGILNLALTPAFILGLGFGIEGAAWAAVLSQAAGLLILVNHYRRKAGLLRIIPPTLERLRRLSPTILRNGMPSLLRNALAAVAASILNLTAGGFGDAAVAAMSIVSRVLMTVNAVMVGLGQGYQPVAGFNWGAGNYARVKKALVSTIVAGTAFTTAAAIPGFIFSESIVSVFAGGDPEVMETVRGCPLRASRLRPDGAGPCLHDDPEGGHEEEHGENEGRNRAPDVDGRVGESLDHVARDDGGRKVRARGRERERREGEAAVFRRRDVAREALDHDVREHEGQAREDAGAEKRRDPEVGCGKQDGAARSRHDGEP